MSHCIHATANEYFLDAVMYNEFVVCVVCSVWVDLIIVENCHQSNVVVCQHVSNNTLNYSTDNQYDDDDDDVTVIRTRSDQLWTSFWRHLISHAQNGNTFICCSRYFCLMRKDTKGDPVCLSYSFSLFRLTNQLVNCQLTLISGLSFETLFNIRPTCCTHCFTSYSLLGFAILSEWICSKY